MPKIISFSKRGLEHERTVQALDLDKNDTVAIWNYCSKDVSVANMKEAALMSHAKGKKHVETVPHPELFWAYHFPFS